MLSHSGCKCDLQSINKHWQVHDFPESWGCQNPRREGKHQKKLDLEGRAPLAPPLDPPLNKMITIPQIQPIDKKITFVFIVSCSIFYILLIYIDALI